MKSIAIEVKLTGIPKAITDAGSLKKALSDIKGSGSVKVDPSALKSVEAAINGISSAQEKNKKTTDGQSEGYVTLSKEISQAKKTLEEMTRAGSASEKEIQGQKNKLTQLTIEQKRHREETRNLVRAKESEENTYKGLSARLSILRNQYKNLVVAEKQSSKEARQLLKNITALDTRLKTIDARVGQYQRNVGNYGGAFATLGKNVLKVFGVFAAADVAQGVIRFTKEAIVLANEARGVQFAFDQIERSGEVLQNARNSTRGLLSDLDIKKSIVEFDNFNLELEELPTLLEFVSVRAAQTGKSFDSLRDSLVEGLSKESLLRIDNLGISSKELNAELEKTPNFVQAVANIAKREIAEAGAVIDAADQAQQKYNASIENMSVLWGEFVSKGLRPAVGALGTFIQRSTEILFPQEKLSDNLRDQQVTLNALINELESANTSEERRSQIIQQLNRDYPELVASIDLETISSEDLRKKLKEVNGEYVERIKLQRQLENTESAGQRVAIQETALDDERDRLFRILNDAIVEYELDIVISKDSLQQSAQEVLSAIEEIDPSPGLTDVFISPAKAFFDFVGSSQDKIKTTLNNIEVLGGFVKSNTKEYEKQNKKLQELGGTIEGNTKKTEEQTEAEKENNDELDKRVKLYNKLFGTNLTELTTQQIDQLNKKLRELNVDANSITGLSKEIAELNQRISEIDPEDEAMQGLIEKLVVAEDRLAAVREEIEKFKVELRDRRSIDQFVDDYLNGLAEMELATAEFALKSKDVLPGDDFFVDNDDITGTTVLFNKLSELRDKYNVEEIQKKEKYTNEEIKVLEQFYDAAKLLELEHAVKIAEIRKDAAYKTNEERLAAEKEYYDALEALSKEKAQQSEKNCNCDDDDNNELSDKDKQEIVDNSFTFAQRIADKTFEYEKDRVDAIKSYRLKQLEDEFALKFKAAEGNSYLIGNLEKQLAKEREKIEYEAFKKKQNIAIKEAVINAALAISKTLATTGFGPQTPALLASTAAITALQIATIKAQRFGEGGLVKGRKHRDGGVTAIMEGGEYVLSEEATRAPGVLPHIQNINKTRRIPDNFRPPASTSNGYRKRDANEVPIAVYNMVHGQITQRSHLAEQISEKLSVSLKDEITPAIKDAVKEGVNEAMGEILPDIERSVEKGSFNGSALGGEESYRRREREQIARDQSQK